MYEDEIKKLLTSKKLLIGKDEVLKSIKKGTMGKVYIASNCPKDLMVDLNRYVSVSGFELLDTKVPNDELGTICKKPFSIAILGVTK